MARSLAIVRIVTKAGAVIGAGVGAIAGVGVGAVAGVGAGEYERRK